MKTILSLKFICKKAMPVLTASMLICTAQAQTGPGGGSSSNNLRFENPQLLPGGTDLQPGARYLFSGVANNMDAIVRIDSLVNGAKVNKIDDNSNGTGFKEAFQPAIQSGNVAGMSYVVFKITFYAQGDTTIPKAMPAVYATALDVDGNSTLKEFGKMNMGVSSVMSYMVATPDIAVTQVMPGEFMGQNVLGVERTGIDTTSLANMFTVGNSNISSFTIKYGTITTVASSPVRQFSLYLKKFDYPGAVLPVKLSAFSAMLNGSNKVDLKWSTGTEANLNYFAVERSIDGINYNDAGIVFGYGNSSEAHDYSLTDNISNIQSTVIYYRLRSVDNDGKSQLSAVRLIRIGKSNPTVSILAYPNPAASEIRVTIPAEWQNKKLVYEVVNMNGQTVKRKEAASSSQTESLNIASLAPGIYMVKVSCEGQTGIQKIVKQ